MVEGCKMKTIKENGGCASCSEFSRGDDSNGLWPDDVVYQIYCRDDLTTLPVQLLLQMQNHIKHVIDDRLGVSFPPHGKVAVFDIDDVIAEGSKEEVYSDEAGWAFEKCTLVPGILKTLAHLRIKGYTIHLNTARWPGDYSKTHKWLVDNNVPFDALFVGKPMGLVYVDDKAFRHVGPWTDMDIEALEHALAGEEWSGNYSAKDRGVNNG
jgi:hypothetical protein